MRFVVQRLRAHMLMTKPIIITLGVQAVQLAARPVHGAASSLEHSLDRPSGGVAEGAARGALYGLLGLLVTTAGDVPVSVLGPGVSGPAEYLDDCRVADPALEG
ncbi:hypothetical protein [Streptomyces sp. NPDC094437]|uniref:hypothetical protein n=1 Tax=Streptomyces sp. NPDC094437 TaxID=3366060 RepID=UPI00380B09F3